MEIQAHLLPLQSRGRLDAPTATSGKQQLPVLVTSSQGRIGCITVTSSAGGIIILGR